MSKTGKKSSQKSKQKSKLKKTNSKSNQKIRSKSGQTASRKIHYMDKWDAVKSAGKPPKRKNKAKPAKLNIKMTPDRWVVAAASVLVLTYVGYQIYITNQNRVRTEMVYIDTLTDTISADGVIVRNEKVITWADEGVVVSTVPNGAKVAGGEAVANIFTSSEAADAYNRVGEIDKAIREFQGMNIGAEDTNAAAQLKKQVSDRLIRSAKAVNDGDYAGARKLRGELLYLLNKRQIAMMVTDGFEGRITELYAERQALIDAYPAIPTPLTSPFSGYYINSADGYESVLNTDILPTLSPEGLDSILAQNPAVTDSAVVGKVADDYRWYVCCILPKSEADKLRPGKEYSIEMPYSGEDLMTAKLMFMTPETIITEEPVQPEETAGSTSDGEEVSGGDIEPAQGRVLAAFQCSYTLTKMAGVRRQPVVIRLSRATGICIRSSAIHRKMVSGTDLIVSNGDEIEVPCDVKAAGVYTLWEKRITYKKVDIIAEFGGMAVCAVKHEMETAYLKQYDEVVVEGNDLYDGKLVRANK